MRMLSLVPVLLILVLSGVGGAMAGEAATDKTALESLNDGSITSAVKGKLAADNINHMSSKTLVRIDVQTERGDVTLSGVVQTAEQKARAEQLVREVNGVKRVTNNLEVRAANQR